MSCYRPKYRDPHTGDLVETEVYWCDFTYKGRRTRESTGQTKLTLARAYEDNRRKEIARAYAGQPIQEAKQRIQNVGTALEEWVQKRIVGKAPKTAAYIRERAAHLSRLLGSELVADLTEVKVAGYILQRESEKAASDSINREVYFLSRVLKLDRATAWPDLGRVKKNRKVIPKAIPEDEEKRILEAARSNRSRYILPFVAIAIRTGLRAGEVRMLRWRQIDLSGGWIRSEQSKTVAGEGREVPMGADLRAILRAHWAWLEKKLKCKVHPDHFVFPFANRGKPVDPERPCTNVASAWWQVRQDAGVTLRLHDLRHTFASRHLEGGTSPEVLRDMMGHVDKRVLDRYTHIRRQQKQAAVEGVNFEALEGHVKESPKGNGETLETHVKESPKVGRIHVVKRTA